MGSPGNSASCEGLYQHLLRSPPSGKVGRKGSGTHQDLVVRPGDSDQAVLPSRANA